MLALARKNVTTLHYTHYLWNVNARKTSPKTSEVTSQLFFDAQIKTVSNSSAQITIIAINTFDVQYL